MTLYAFILFINCVGDTVKCITKEKNCILFIDEPESALSIRSQFKLIQAINKAIENGCQVFIATHCYPLIQSVSEVYSLEHMKWMNSNEFINNQMII